MGAAAGFATAEPPARGRPAEGSLKIGDAAPDFNLKRLPGEKPAGPDAPRADGPAPPAPAPGPQDAPAPKTVRLSDFQGKRPVVLVFGSYT